MRGEWIRELTYAVFNDWKSRAGKWFNDMQVLQ